MSEQKRSRKKQSAPSKNIEPNDGLDRAKPGPLPVPLTSLVGREHDIAQVTALLQSGETRLLTLTGPGGVGKTRLALQVAANLHPSFSGGAYFISLAPISNPDLALPTIAQTLGVRESSGQTPLDTLCSALSSKHILLILDNFEQILPAGPQVLDLLQCNPRLQVLVTSRAIMHIYGEHEYRVSPLSLPDTAQHPSLEQLTQYESVRLFIDRARAARSDFAINNRNAPAVAEICYRLDGLPLALELAAARIKLMSPQLLLSQLDRRLPLLTGGPDNLPQRHRTLRNAIAWSYDLLSDDEKGLFRGLSVFVGGCTLEAAEAVCTFEAQQANQETDGVKGAQDSKSASTETSILDKVAALADKSLLRYEEQDDGLNAGIEVKQNLRFSMLETLREFALEQLAASKEVTAMQRRHAEYYVRLADEARPSMEGPEATAWLDRLERDHSNLRAALNWLLDQGEADAAEDALRLLVNIGLFWDRARPNEREGWLEKALLQLGNKITPLRVSALRRASVLARWQGNFQRARARAEQSVEVATELGDKRLLTGALSNMAVVELFEANYSAAHDLLEGALAVYRELSDDTNIAATLVNLGEVARYQGDYVSAEGYYKESMGLFRAIGEPTGIMASTLNLGQAAQHLGNFEQARASFQEVLALAQKVDSPARAAAALTGLSSVMLAEMEQPAAANPLGQTLRVMKQIARISGLAASLLERSGRLLEPPDQVEFDTNVAAARAGLGEQAFATAWDEGKALPLEKAMTLVLDAPGALMPTEAQATQSTTFSAARTHKSGSDLTRREIEVLRLVAAGLTNPDIAEYLTLSVLTVQTHLHSIFSKINVKTRVAAVRYVFEHNLG